ncbi:Putative recombinase [Faustovirus ST1]|nr:Putative recombinase [Faustovirus ST1]
MNAGDKLNDDLTEFITSRVHPDIKQRTDKWCEVKMYTVGGSQVAVLEGANPYETERDLVAHKVGLEDKKAKGAMFEIAVNWGNVFEDVLRKYAEMIYKCKVVADDAFILDTECEAMSYSPDGLGIVEDPGSGERYIALFEFKCPWSRQVGGKIPKYYRSQVLMGLGIIHVAAKGIYLEAAFRLCRADQFDNTTSHITLPKQSAVKTDLEECLLKGVFKVSNAIVAAESRDLALLPPENIMRLINDAAAGICHFEHVDQIPEDSVYLCWKLLDYNIIYVDPVPGYLTDLRPKAQEVIGIVKKYKSMDKADAVKHLDAKYGKVGFSDEGMC